MQNNRKKRTNGMTPNTPQDESKKAQPEQRLDLKLFAGDVTGDYSPTIDSVYSSTLLSTMSFSLSAGVQVGAGYNIGPQVTVMV